jgi:hypothetical protein
MTNQTGSAKRANELFKQIAQAHPTAEQANQALYKPKRAMRSAPKKKFGRIVSDSHSSK